ncbi:site-specific integrase [uncultured Tateyamaria sp.]|uniref:site-specific integrase n=1 Tax=uncultured Tateyamaria sp. TaxID=455651 RepID=UPI0026388E3E|nr:site-specific integrase [uncultured Tateyamaria sp.]
MNNYESAPVKQLIEVTNREMTETDTFTALADVRAENVWLANFSSSHTRDAYNRAVDSFVATTGMTTPDDLYGVKQAHVLAWRASMEAAGFSPASIAASLAALSSLYKHLTDQQLTYSSPVAEVRRPRTGNAGMGAGKSPTLSKRQVRAMLDAPNVETAQGLRDRALLRVFILRRGAGVRTHQPPGSRFYLRC